MTINSSPGDAPSVVAPKPLSKQSRRYLQAAAFVGLWMTIGWIFRLGAESYLVIGVPLTAAFQAFVRRQPLGSLWVRDATLFRLSRPRIILALVLGVALAVLPAMLLLDSFKSGSWRTQVSATLWTLCGVVGAFGAGFSLSHFHKPTWKSLLLCLATAGVIGCAIMGLAFLVLVLTHKHAAAISWSQAKVGLSSFLVYVPICFVLEEVSFRGALDAHVHQPGDRYPWLSAFFVSCLWGLWHLPIHGERKILNVILLAIAMPLVHSATGIFLSFGWRRSGNLAVPAIVHSFIDAVRNMLMN